MAAVQRVRQSFQRMGYPPGSMIRQAPFFNLLDELNGGLYDRAVAGEVWDQASKGQSNQARTEQLCDIIVEAQRILNGRIQDTATYANYLVSQQKRVQQTHMNPRDKQIQIMNLGYQLDQARKDLAEYEDDLKFGIVNQSHYSQNSSYMPQFQPNRPGSTSINPVPVVPLNYSQYPLNNSAYPANHPNNASNFQGNNTSYFDPDMVPTAPVSEDLKIVLWIAIAMGVLEIIIMYKKFDFLNVCFQVIQLLIIVTLLSIFLLDYFDGTYVKVCVGLIVFSIVLDIVWLCMYASTFWSPPVFSEHFQSQVVYLRFVVIFALLILIVKMPLAVLLFKYRDVAQNTNYTIPVYGKTKLQVVASRRGNNLVSQGCGHLPIF